MPLLAYTGFIIGECCISSGECNISEILLLHSPLEMQHCSRGEVCT